MSITIEVPIPKGSKEHIVVDVTDRLRNITDLSTANVKFDTRGKNAATWIQLGISATVIGMRCYCLIDTTLAEYIAGKYELFVYFDNIPETPRLGPVEFFIDA